MRGTAGRRRAPRESTAQPPSQSFRHTHHRDSDASFASSRPSSAGLGRSAVPAAIDIIKDRSFQHRAVEYINEFLSLNSSPLSLKHSSIPSGKEIIEILSFVLEKLNFQVNKLEDDLPSLLKSLNCPFKVSKSAIRIPATPTAWPSVCAVIHWLAEHATVSVYIETEAMAAIEHDSMHQYVSQNYQAYISGNDDAVEALDNDFMSKFQLESGSMAKNVEELIEEVNELERKVDEMKRSSRKEELDKERGLLEEDVKKFHTMIAEINGRIADVNKVLEGKAKELALKVDENKRISEENAELKKQVELQTINARDVERMRRELQAVERDIEESEAARSSWDEKCWDVDSEIGHKFKELEQLSLECNTSMRRLKLAESLQFNLNAKGYTVAEVIGIDYKTRLKPALKSMADSIKKIHMEKLEELITLQKHIQEKATKNDAKKKCLDELQTYIDEVEAQVNLLGKEIHDYVRKRETECKKLEEDGSLEAYNLDTVEKEAEEILKTTKLNLQETTRKSEDEVQMYAHELFKLVNSISKHKEHVTFSISVMENDIAETSAAIAAAYKSSLPRRTEANKKQKM